MSHVIDDATSAMHDTYDETASMPNTTVPLSEFLDEQIARAREKEIIETDYIDESDDEDTPVIPEGYVFDMEASTSIFACKGRSELKRLLVKWNHQSLNDRMRRVKEICPRGNNKVIIYFLTYHDKCLLFMLELY